MRNFRRGLVTLLFGSVTVLAACPSLIGLITFAGSVVGLAITPALADEAVSAEAKDVVNRMGKTLASGGFSFTTHTIRQFQKDDLPLHIFHTAEVTVRRPDRLMIDIAGDDGQAQLTYDGTTATVLSLKANKYGQMPISGSIETMLRTASERMGMDFPLADLLADQPGQAFLSGVLAGQKVGDVTLADGQQVGHYLFLQPPGIELELWAEDDERALPRRIIATYRSLPGEPQFIAEMSDWKLGLNPPDASFVAKIPPGASKVEKEQSQ